MSKFETEKWQRDSVVLQLGCITLVMGELGETGQIAYEEKLDELRTITYRQINARKQQNDNQTLILDN